MTEKMRVGLCDATGVSDTVLQFGAQLDCSRQQRSLRGAPTH